MSQPPIGWLKEDWFANIDCRLVTREMFQLPMWPYVCWWVVQLPHGASARQASTWAFSSSRLLNDHPAQAEQKTSKTSSRGAHDGAALAEVVPAVLVDRRRRLDGRRPPGRLSPPDVGRAARAQGPGQVRAKVD